CASTHGRAWRSAVLRSVGEPKSEGGYLSRTNEDFGEAARPSKTAVAMLVLPARAARTWRVALGTAPGGGVVGIHGAGRLGGAGGHLVLAGERVDMAFAHRRHGPGLQRRRRLAGGNLHMHQLLHHLAAQLGQHAL